MTVHFKWSINVNYRYYYILTRATNPAGWTTVDPQELVFGYPPSVIGAGLGPEKGLEALGISGDLEDKTGRRVVGTGLVELRPSVATTGVVPAGMVPAWALTEAQHSMRTSRSRGKARGPIAHLASWAASGWVAGRPRVT